MGRRTTTLVCTTLVLFGASGCSSAEKPVRIGVLADCSGLFAQSRELSLAAVSLPLIERGARIADDGVVAGVQDATVAGRTVELIPECTEFTYVHRLVAATRRLVEERHAEIVIGPIGSPDGFVFRELADRFPDVTFLHGVTTSQEVTLRDAPDNLFRFTPDGAQSLAGLGAYAYRDLGWRKAVVVGEPFVDQWEAAAGFIAEFCSLGGAVVERDWSTLQYDPKPTTTAHRHATKADGVVLLTDYTSPTAYLRAYRKAVERLPVSLLVGGSWFSATESFREQGGVDLRGVVRAGYIPLAPDAAGMREYKESFADAFPGLGASAGDPLAVPRYTAMNAVLNALEATGGELGHGQVAFRQALRSRETDAPFGAVKLDRNRQMTGHTYLERATAGAGGKTVMEPVRTLDGVEQRFDGIFTPASAPPSAVAPACVRGTPPPWAR